MYDLPNGNLLMVATDRISAFDFILSPEIPDKGKVLTQMSLWWFEKLADLVANHVVSESVPVEVSGRAIEAEPLKMIEVECVARGYLTGSGWEEYQQTGTACGVKLPAGLQDGSKLDQPIFTPAMKAPVGEHDENVDYETMCAAIGQDLGAKLRELTLECYSQAERIASERGIILADTKFEFGLRQDGTIVLADEVLTPDSSRFWDGQDWQNALAEGRSASSFDKQFVRDWLAKESGWDRKQNTPPPGLPEQVVQATRLRYLQAYKLLTGQEINL